MTDMAGANRHIKQVIFDHLVICNPPFGGYRRCMGDRIIAGKRKLLLNRSRGLHIVYSGEIHSFIRIAPCYPQNAILNENA